MVKTDPTLDVLFDSPVRARILKLFLYSPEENFDCKTISKVLGVRTSVINKHLKNLGEIRFLGQKNIKGKKFFRVNKNFGFYNELKELLAKTTPASKEKILKRLKGLGRIKLILISGVFINFDAARADLLIVGDNIKLKKFDKFIEDLGAEVGKEINYALMTTKEFYYRHDMYDKFIRDLLEFKHEKLINKLEV